MAHKIIVANKKEEMKLAKVWLLLRHGGDIIGCGSALKCLSEVVVLRNFMIKARNLQIVCRNSKYPTTVPKVPSFNE